MESHGVPGGIQVSAATWAKLRGRYQATPRGTLEIKGVGPVEAYLLEGRAVELSPRSSPPPRSS
jgi:adenylate cyclase